MIYIYIYIQPEKDVIRTVDCGLILTLNGI